MNDMPQFDDSDLPDFDSMSQEELIEWLEQLAKSQSQMGSEFIDGYEGDNDENEAEILPVDEDEEVDWSAWLDETAPLTGSESSSGVASLTIDDNDDTPVDLNLFDDEDTAPTAAIDWLEEITAGEQEDKLPDISEYRPPERQPDSFDELLAAGDSVDPLDWLDSLASEVSDASVSAPSYADRDDAEHTIDDADDDFDDSYEDDETLDDLEDESLYTHSVDESMSFLESLLGLVDRESEKYSTQSMAPVPEIVKPAAPSDLTRVADGAIAPPAPEHQAEPSDSLTQAFLLQEQQGDMEAWYKKRLRALATEADSAPPPPTRASAKPPPPGLAAAINSARSKMAANDLRNALGDYETLLRTTAGLEWVVSDMRALITQSKFRETPSVHRVLGDALMRQGHLDAALDVYRYALSLL